MQDGLRNQRGEERVQDGLRNRVVRKGSFKIGKSEEWGAGWFGDWQKRGKRRRNQIKLN